MPIPDRFNPTLEMVKAYSEGERHAEEQYRELLSKALALWDAYEGWPGSNAGKPVLFGAAKWCLNMSQYLRGAAQELKWGLDRDFTDLTRYQHRLVGMGFITREKFDLEYQHLYTEMTRLEGELAKRR